MNAISKRLLSWLCVIAMVLSYVPVMDLSNFAVETKAAATNPGASAITAAAEIQRKANEIVFPTEGNTHQAYCPKCEETVTWTRRNITTSNPLFSDQFKTLEGYDHLYLTAADGASFTNMNFMTTNGLPSTLTTEDSICVHLNGVNINISSRFFINRKVTVNIMGNGTITSNGVGLVDGDGDGTAETPTAGQRATTYGLFQLAAAAKLNLYGGTYNFTEGAKLAAGAYGTIGLTVSGAEANIYNNVVLDATGATNVNMAANTVFNMYGGTIQNGDAYTYSDYNDGGNVFIGNGAVFTMYDGTIKDGECVRFGGNVHMNGTNSKFIMYDGLVDSGEATGASASGGNLSGGTGSICEIHGGTVSNGTIPLTTAGGSWGGNCRFYQATLKISGGYIYGGTKKTNTNNQYAANIGIIGGSATSKANLEISGGNIAGDIQISTHTTVKLSGSPKIMYQNLPLEDGTTVNGKCGGLQVNTSAPYDISELSRDAQIQITGSLNNVFTAADDNAANVVNSFSCTGSGQTVAVTGEGASAQLKIVEKVFDANSAFEPEKNNGQAWCPVCGSVQTWSAYAGGSYNDATAYSSDAHLYLAEDITLNDANTFLVSYRDICFNLNGHDITRTVPGASIFHVRTFDLMDTEGGAVVTGYSNNSANAAAVHSNNGRGLCNITVHGGTYTKQAADVVGSIMYIGSNGGSITIKDGAVIDAEGLTGSAVKIVGGTSEANQFHAAGSFTMDGGTIKGGTAENGGSVFVSTQYATFTMNGGSITGGTAVDGGNVYAVAGATLTVNGGTISGGTVTQRGGNLYAACDVTIGANAKILNGRSKSTANGHGGGNIFVSSAKLTTSGTITGGRVEADEADKVEKPQASGGNIHISGANAICQVDGGVIANGYVDCSGGHGSPYGGNIRAYNNTVIINDGLIYGGTGNNGNGASIGVQGGVTAGRVAELEINGGIIVGDISYADYVPETAVGESTFEVNIKLTGSPKIYKSYDVPGVGTVTASTYGLRVTDKATLDISGLSADAHIEVTCATNAVVGKAFTVASDKAATVLSAFSCTDSSYIVALTDDGQQLQVVENVTIPVVGVFNPEACGGMAYCPVCYENGTNTEPVEWTAYNGENYSEATVLTDSKNANAHYHLYLADDFTMEAGKSFLISYRTVCFNLNGNDITAVSGSNHVFGITKTLNIMDTEGGAVVTGYKDDVNTAATLHVNGGNASATYNIYGGTFTKNAADTKSPIVLIHTNGGRINMYGGTIDAEGLTGSAVKLSGASGKNAQFYMYDGEIKGGTSTDGGSVFLNSAYASFYMEDGTISGGTANKGGNIRGGEGSTIEIAGGTIYGGTIENIEGSEGANWGGNIYSWNSKVTISGGLIYGGYDAKGNSEGSNIAVLGDKNGDTKTVLEISGGTIVGDISTSAPKADGTFTGTKVTLSGAPKIVTSYDLDANTNVKASFNGLYLPDNTMVDASGLTAGAQIEVTNKLDVVFSADTYDATNVAQYFDHTNELYYVAVNADGRLYTAKNMAGIIQLNGDTVWYPTAADAVAAYTGEGVLRPNGDNVEFVLNGGDYYIDGRGWTVTVSGTGKLYAIDNANGDPSSQHYLKNYGGWYVAESVEVIRDVTNPVNGWRFIVLDQTSNGVKYYGAHRIEIKLTNVSLRTGPSEGDFSNPGLFYKASYMCDSTLASRITTYGVALSLDAIPGTDFLTGSAMEDFADQYDAENHVVSGNSCALVNIMSETATDNIDRVKTTVYANAYIEVDVDNDGEGDTVFMGDTDNVGKTDSGVRYSMLDILKYIDTNWANYESQQDLVKNFISHWIAKDSGLAALATELPAIVAALNA